jgi:uncharacterized protein with NRDE domain
MWLGVTKSGKFAALTNVRDMSSLKPHALSRGDLVTNWLKEDQSPASYAAKIQEKAPTYNGYNLIYGDFQQLYFQSNVNANLGPIKKGVHGVSNAALDTPWPKVLKAKSEMERLLSSRLNAEKLAPELFDFMSSEEQAPDHLLPNTGIGLEWERKLSALNIRTDNYGTRVTSVVMVDSGGLVQVIELNRVTHERAHFEFQLASFS